MSEYVNLDNWSADPEQIMAKCQSNECKGARRAFYLWPKGITPRMEYFRASCTDCGYSLPFEREIKHVDD